MEGLVRHVHSAPKHRPPRLYLHFEARGLGGLSCTQSAATHVAVATRHAVPYLSFMAAICNGSDVAAHTIFNRQLYPAGCGWLDREGFDCGVHPGPTVHAAYAAAGDEREPRGGHG